MTILKKIKKMIKNEKNIKNMKNSKKKMYNLWKIRMKMKILKDLFKNKNFFNINIYLNSFDLIYF
jgi:hypothetical protein